MKASTDHSGSVFNGTEGLLLQNRENQTNRIVAMIFFWLIILVGLIGNSFIITVVRVVQCMKTTTNYLLVNVAVADITTLLFTAIHLIIGETSSNGPFPNGALGGFLCKFVYTNTITIVTLLVTVMTLTIVAVERYNALVRPMRMSRRLTTEKIGCVIINIWLVAMVLVLPLLIVMDREPGSTHGCSPGGAIEEIRIYVFCLVVTLTLIPFLFIAFCYLQIISGLYFRNTICSSGQTSSSEQELHSQEKKRLTKLLILLTAVFFVAFVPYGVVLILKFSRVENNSDEELQVISRFQTGAQYLIFLSFSANPFIYAFQSSNYRQGFKLIAKRMLCRDLEAEASELRSRTSRPNV